MSEPAFPGIAGQVGSGNSTFRINADGFEEEVQHNQGMTLLDYFAGQALAGMLADPTVTGPCAKVAESAYNFAQAMLDERAKRG